jgi:hypothetical protein
VEWFLDILSELFVWFVEGWTGWLGLAGVLGWVGCCYLVPGVAGIVLGFVAFAALLAVGIWLDRRAATG